MAPPIVTATVQATVISAISNILAQAITAHQSNTSLVVDWISVFQYALFTAVSTPPNFLWQGFLEGTFPGQVASPAPRSSSSSSSSPSKAKPKDDKDDNDDGKAVQPRLSKRNTLAKTLLDQTAGAVVNTLAFSLFMHGLRQAMAHHYAALDAADADPRAAGLGFLFAPDAVRYGAVQWAAVWAQARGEFWGLIKAGWRFWPFVSLTNYLFLTSIEARSLAGAVAGFGWGIYLSLMTVQK